MRTRALLSLLAASIAAVALVSGSGAATTKAQNVTRFEVSTRAAVIHYLRSIHVNPKGVVIQRGLRNYAGAHCPGKHWICARTNHPVVQIAKAGGTNTFRCAATNCAVVQIAGAAATGTNTAKCIKIVGLSQTCTINQSSTTQNNVAVVYQLAVGVLARTQTASQTASITQTATGASNKNTACVSQSALIDGSTVSTQPVTVALNAQQTINVNQDSSNGGNSAQSSATLAGACDTAHPLAQSQVLNSIVAGRGAVTQNENAAGGENMTIDIEQNQSSGFFGTANGPNSANFNQTNSLTAVADTTAGPISQTQSSLTGGLLGTINQDSRDVSTAHAKQTETQCEDAAKSGLIKCDSSDADASQAPAALTQTQYGPEGLRRARASSRGPVGFSVHKGVGTATQTGNSGDTFSVTQTSTQNNDQGAGSNQANNVQGDCSTPGSCTVTQNTNVDGQTHTNTQSGQEVNTTTNCTGTTCQTPEIVFDGSPGTAAPPSTLGPYTMTPFGPNEADEGCVGSQVTSVNDPAGTITFDEALTNDIVPQCWATWSNGYEGDVYGTVDSQNPTQVTINLPSGTQAFYFYAEPDNFADFMITATAQDGTTSGPVTVNGNSGAKYYGFYGINGGTVSSITVTTTDIDFAIGEFGISPAQTP